MLLVNWKENRLVYRKGDADLYQRLFGNLHRCTECKYSTRSMFCLQNHIKKHETKGKRFSCQESTPEEYFCAECTFSTHLKAYFKQHIREYHCLKKENEETKLNLKTYTCEKCLFWTTKSLTYLKKHIYCKHVDKRNMCSKHSCDVDINVHHCGECEYKNTVLSHLRQYESSEHKTNGIEYICCNFCNYTSIWTNSLKDHIRRNHTPFENIEWFSCDQCEYKSKMPLDMRRHKVAKHRSAEKKFKCNHCDYITGRKFDFKKHVLFKHTADESVKWILCDQCEYKCKSKSQLNRHLLIHSNVRKFQCHQCDCKFKNKRNLNQHMLKHKR